MKINQAAIELARILLENEIEFLKWEAEQKQKTGALTRQDDNAPAQDITPAKSRSKEIVPDNG